MENYYYAREKLCSTVKFKFNSENEKTYLGDVPKC